MIESDLILRFGEKLEIPPACMKCPALRELANHHDAQANQTARAADFVVSGRLEASMRRMLQTEGMTDQEIEALLASQQEEIRRINTATVDSMYEHLDSAVAIGEKMVKECPSEGALKLRARRSGQQVLVTLCMSRFMMEATETTGLPGEAVTVERTLLEKTEE